MTKDEMQRLVALNTATFTGMKTILDAVDAYLSASNGAKPVVSGLVPPIEDEVLHYFYHIGAADALVKAISRNGGKPDFEKRLKEFKEGQGGNAR